MKDFKENRHFPDDLFKKKLEGHEAPVRGEVWQRLQGKMYPKPKPIWKSKSWLAAAVLAGITAGAGIWLIRTDAPDSVATVVPEPTSQSMEESPAATADELLQQSPPADIEPGDVAVAQETRGAQPAESKQESIGTLAISQENETAIQRASRDSPRATPSAPLRGEESRAVELAKSDKPILDQQKSETRVLVVYVTPPERIDEPQTVSHDEVAVVLETPKAESEVARKKGLQRLFKQLKNAKTGEKIDWEELGLNPNRVFANVDHGFQE